MPGWASPHLPREEALRAQSPDWGAAQGRGRQGEAWSIRHPWDWSTPFRDRPWRSLLKGRQPPAADPDTDSTALPSDGTVQSPSGVKAGTWFSHSSLKDADHQGELLNQTDGPGPGS